MNKEEIKHEYGYKGSGDQGHLEDDFDHLLQQAMKKIKRWEKGSYTGQSLNDRGKECTRRDGLWIDSVRHSWVNEKVTLEMSHRLILRPSNDPPDHDVEK